MLGIEGYQPQWQHHGSSLAAAHRHRFGRLIGRRLMGGWLLWDLDAGVWFPDGPVVLGFGDTNVEITHRKFDECAVTWDTIDMSSPPGRPGRRLDWRGGAHPALHRVCGQRLCAVNVIERLTPARWRPTVLHAVEFRFEGPTRLAIFNAIDENGLTDADEIDLAVGRWRRVEIA